MKNSNYFDITHEICKYFSEKIEKARLEGINDIIIDPGFGFSKTIEQNYELLNMDSNNFRKNVDLHF